MADDEPFRAAVRDLWARQPRIGSRWRHKKSGRRCWVKGGCLIEATLTPAVIYQEAAQHSDDTTAAVDWVRPLQEFLERFEEVTS